MEWKRYESKIMDEYQVLLEGWPVKDFDLHVLSIKDLEICLEALKGPEPTCYWRKLSEVELIQHQEEIIAKKVAGEITTKPRKKRSDAGKKQGSRSKKRVANDSEKENEGREDMSPMKKTQSALLIPSDEDSD
jgi:hypothetical protein